MATTRGTKTVIEEYEEPEEEVQTLPDEVLNFIETHDLSENDFTCYLYRKGVKGMPALEVLHGECPTLTECGEKYGSGKYQIKIATRKNKKDVNSTIYWNLSDPVWDERKRLREEKEAGRTAPRGMAGSPPDQMASVLQGMQIAQSMMAPMFTAMEKMFESLAGMRNSQSSNSVGSMMKEFTEMQMGQFQFLQQEQAKLLQVGRNNAGVNVENEADDNEEMTTKDLIKTVVEVVVDKGAEFLKADGVTGKVMTTAIKSQPEFKAITSDPKLIDEALKEITRETGDPNLGPKVLQKLGVQTANGVQG